MEKERIEGSFERRGSLKKSHRVVGDFDAHIGVPSPAEKVRLGAHIRDAKPVSRMVSRHRGERAKGQDQPLLPERSGKVMSVRRRSFYVTS